MGAPSATFLACIERSRQRLWMVCYRMTGRTSDADDLCQEAIARAIERFDQQSGEDPTGWLLRIATTTCLDHLRKEKVCQRVTALADPLDLADVPAGEADDDPERRAILREDVRFAVIVALQRLTPLQRAAIILHDVCDRPLAEAAVTLDCKPNAAKALIHRARRALADARHRDDVDVPANLAVVEALGRAIESGDLDALGVLLLEDAWGVTDGGGIVRAASRPSFGRRSIVKRFANAWRQLGMVGMEAERKLLNGEPAVVARLRGVGFPVAVIHVETKGGHIAALRIDRDPRRIAVFAKS
jgi:RNA polymerase sigma-70 factor (ECF subfamily)